MAGVLENLKRIESGFRWSFHDPRLPVIRVRRCFFSSPCTSHVSIARALVRCSAAALWDTGQRLERTSGHTAGFTSFQNAKPSQLRADWAASR
jgi:hypothetical protein